MDWFFRCCVRWSNCGTPIREIADHVSDALGVDSARAINRGLRRGEMRHRISDTSLARSAGYEPAVDLCEGIGRYSDWIRAQSDIRHYCGEASGILKN